MVSVYLSRIQREIIAEGGTQTSPAIRSAMLGRLSRNIFFYF
jgi:hypothetical protein